MRGEDLHLRLEWRIFAYMTKLIIFDLDGTLLDTVEDLGNATNHALRTLGYPEHPMDAYKIFCGRGIYNLFRAALPPQENNEENVARMAALFLPWYDAHICDRTRPYPGIMDMMDRLHQAGIRFALASNKYQDGAEKLIRIFFGEYGFIKVLGQRDGLPIKPDPAIVHQAMAAAPDVRLAEVVYVGDTNTDMQTGGNAGVRTIGVLWGFRTREELAAYHPWKIVSTAEELTKALIHGT